MESSTPADPGTTRAAPLSAETWVLAAADAITEGGIEAVRVEPLAARLGVTKGSFYWHFRDRDALLQALLDYWEHASTQSVIERMERITVSPRRRLELLFEFVADGERMATEAAIRAWAQSDPRAAVAARRIDQQRERYVAGLLGAMGLGPEAAAGRARLACLAVIGEIASVPYHPSPNPHPFWHSAFELLTADLPHP